MLAGNKDFCGPVPPLLRPAVSPVLLRLQARPTRGWKHEPHALSAMVVTTRTPGAVAVAEAAYGHAALLRAPFCERLWRPLQVCQDPETTPSNQCTKGEIVCQGQA